MLTLLRRIAPLLLLAATAGCEDPPAPCHVATAPYYARYRVLSQSGGLCDIRIGEEVGIEVYPGRGPDGPDSSRPSIAVQSSFMGQMAFMVDRDEQRPYSFGSFPELADADGLCRPGDLAPADVQFPSQVVFDDLGNPFEVPGAHVRETWKDLRMLVTHSLPGVRFAAELTVEDLTNGCSVRYEVSALSPSVDCSSFFPEATPGDELCSPEPDPSTGNPSGSGIDPRIQTRCDSNTLHCVLVGSPLDPL
ncbi:hypothetical protein [Polyangium sp. 6x1]|uniref:hypothetical protein n=1 Tax=Polyangium sp. 6x1 TaxID=3042689 RepID=UPI002483026B|nr:hypothetical protein [Polyangium sp. 6x1]MDI1448466.1 hypothetical protein [Polyangium sp. 6x1]